MFIGIKRTERDVCRSLLTEGILKIATSNFYLQLQGTIPETPRTTFVKAGETRALPVDTDAVS